MVRNDNKFHFHRYSLDGNFFDGLKWALHHLCAYIMRGNWALQTIMRWVHAKYWIGKPTKFMVFDNGTRTLFSYLQKNNNFLANYLHLNDFQEPLFWPLILNFPGYPHMFKVGSYSLLRNLKNANIWNALDWKSAQQLKTVCQVCQHL